MFKITIPVTKAKKDATKNVLVVEGIASDPSIDRDNERFSEDAVKKMAEHIANWEIPIRAEHENKYYSDIGVWKEAKMIWDKLRVKGEIDLDYSMGKDLAVGFEKGKTVALSVWGRVVDATMEYVKELWRMIKTYTDVVLSEISIVKNPSNYNASLSIAKSFDADKHQETTEAQKIVEYYKSLQPLKEETMEKALTPKQRENMNDSTYWYVATVDGAKVRKLPMPDATHVSAAIAAMHWARWGVDIPASAKAGVWRKIRARAKALWMDTSELKLKSDDVTKYVVDVDSIMKQTDKHTSFDTREFVTKSYDNNFWIIMKQFRGEVGKCCDCVDSCNTTPDNCIQPADIKLITNLVKALQDVGSEKIDRPKELEDWETVANLPAESFVLDIDSRLMPHHNEDFTINKDRLDYQLSSILWGDYTRLCAKDFNIALNHLYHHYQEETMKDTKKVTKSDEAKAEGLDTVVEVPAISNEEVELMSKCYGFYTKKITDRPQVNGNDLSDKDVKKVAEAYRAMMERKRHKGSLGMQMSGQFHTDNEATKPAGSTDGQAAVNKSLPINENNMEIKKNTDGTEDTLVETTIVEEVSDASETPVAVTEETTPVVETTVVEGEPQAVEATAEVTPEDAPAVEGAVEEVTKAADVTPWKKMSDYNAKRQAREAVAEKADTITELEWDEPVKSKVKKDESVLDKIDLLAKSLEDGEAIVEAVEETVEEATVAEETEKSKKPAEEDEEDMEKAKAKKDDGDNDEDDMDKSKSKKVEEDEDEEDAKKSKAKKDEEEEEKCMKSTADVAVEKLTELLTNNLVPMMKSFQKSLNDLTDTVTKSQNITKSFHEDKFADVTKAQSDLQATVAQMAGTIELIAKTAQPRKSLASFVAMEKSFSVEAANEDMQNLVQKKMDEGMSLAQALTFAKSQ